MSSFGPNRRKHVSARDSFRALEQLEPRLLLSVNTLVKSSVPTTQNVTLQPATTVTSSPSIVSSNSVNGRTTSVSVVSSAGDLTAYSYIWKVTEAPVGGTVSFAKNSSNLAKANTLTFTNAGTYVVSVTVMNGSKVISSGGLKYTVTPTLSGIGVTTDSGKAVTKTAVAVSGTSLQLVATAFDQFGTPMTKQPTFTWLVVKQPTGVATTLIKTENAATTNFNSTGAYTLRAQSGVFSFDVPITVAQTLTSYSISTLDNVPVESDQSLAVTTKNLQLSFNAKDQFGNAMTLLPKITWKTTQAPEGGKSTASLSRGILNVTYSGPGTYTTEASIAGQTFRFTSEVASTFSAIRVQTPANQTLTTSVFKVSGTSQRLSAIAVDQFGSALPDQPAISWLTPATPVGGTATLTADSDGMLVEFNHAGKYTISASSGNVVFVAQLNLVPTMMALSLLQTDGSPVDANQAITVAATVQKLAVYGIDQFGNAMTPTGIQWTMTSAPNQGSVSTRLSAAVATLTFTKPGDYSVVAKSGSFTAAAAFHVVQSLSKGIAYGAKNQVLQNSATFAVTGTNTFVTAIGLDQFGNSMSQQPTFTWTVATAPSGGQATIDATDHNATFNFSKSGTYTVKAISGNVSISLKINVGQTATSLAITTGDLTIGFRAKQQLVARVLDQFGTLLTQQPSVSWSAAGGTISFSGSFTAGSQTGTFSIGARTGTLSATISVNVIAPPTPNGLNDPKLMNLVNTFYADQTIDRAEMIQILRSAGEDGSVNTTELADLRFIVSTTTPFAIPDYVRVLANNVVTTNPANRMFQGQTLGNLASGSSVTVLNNLIDKWFLGADVPLISTSGVTYQTSTGNLFNGIPSRADAKQGQLGDCYFISSLAGIADRNPNAVKDLFTDNGDGTYTVRFYPVGSGTPKADYVTVDRRLPAYSNRTLAYSGFGKSVTSTSTTLWIALAEKAYAQWNETGKEGRDGTNRYSAIEGGWMANVNAQALGYSSTSYTLSNQQTLFNALASNQAVTIGTKATVSTAGLFGSHAYIVTGYTSTTGKFSLYNPWGTSHPAPLTWAQLQSDCSMFVATNTTSLTGVASAQAKSTPPMTQSTIVTTSTSSLAAQPSSTNVVAVFVSRDEPQSRSAVTSNSDANASTTVIRQAENDAVKSLEQTKSPLRAELSREQSSMMMAAELIDLAFLDLDLSTL